MKTISAKLLPLNNKQFIAYCFLLSLSVTLLTTILTHLIPGIDIALKSDLIKQGVFYLFLYSVLIVPLVETFIFQYVIIELGYLFLEKDKMILFISAFHFGLAHYFNSLTFLGSVLYFVVTFLSGLTWAFIYVLAKKRIKISPFFLVLSLHIFENLIVFIINEYRDLW